MHLETKDYDPLKYLIETRELTKIYGDGEEIRALDGVNLKVAHGELIAVMGPSGSGKSTLLNMIGALDKPTSGQVFIEGKNLATIRNKDAFRAKTVGFVFQLRLKDRSRHLPNQLSGGQRQRVAVGRALANKPPLVLADELTGNLDSVAGQEIMKLLRELNQSQGTTFIVVTHDLSVARQTNRVVIMADGLIVREDIIGSPIEEDLKMWRHSGLGRRILSKDEETVASLGIDESQIKLVQSILEQANRE